MKCSRCDEDLYEHTAFHLCKNKDRPYRLDCLYCQKEEERAYTSCIFDKVYRYRPLIFLEDHVMVQYEFCEEIGCKC
jgi:hypothetical protein